MLLAVAATEIEMQPLAALRPAGNGLNYCLSGVGPLEAAVRLTRYLSQACRPIRGVINFGIAGAYQGERSVEVLDLCLAEREVFGDYGVCIGATVEPFANPNLAGCSDFPLSPVLFDHARKRFPAVGLVVSCGTFVTVAAASGTAVRGRYMQERFQGLCENMEGAAVARVCQEFNLPMVEVRAISNMVEDRPGQPWKIDEACRRAAAAAALLVDTMSEVL